MYAPPMPLEQPPMVDRPGVRALRGARPQMTPEMQRMRDWANSQRTATAANARNGDFILNPAGSGAAPAGVGIPTQMPTGDWRSAAPSKPSGWVSREDGPGKPSGWTAGLWADALASAGSGAAPAGVGIPTQMPTGEAPGKPMPPVKPGMLPNKPMEAPPPDKRGRLTGRRG